MPEEFEWIIQWAPVQNVAGGVEYPLVFLFTGHMVSRVDPVEGLKFVATLQNATSSEIRSKPILLDFHPRVGHSLGGRPVLDRIRFIARQFAYLNWQLGVEEPDY